MDRISVKSQESAGQYEGKTTRGQLRWYWIFRHGELSITCCRQIIFTIRVCADRGFTPHFANSYIFQITLSPLRFTKQFLSWILRLQYSNAYFDLCVPLVAIVAGYQFEINTIDFYLCWHYCENKPMPWNQVFALFHSTYRAIYHQRKRICSAGRPSIAEVPLFYLTHSLQLFILSFLYLFWHNISYGACIFIY